MAPPIFALAPSHLSSSPPPLPHHLLRATVGTLAESAAERRGGGGGGGGGGNPVHLPPPIESLRRGDWVKLICGASFEVTVPKTLVSLTPKPPIPDQNRVSGDALERIRHSPPHLVGLFVPFPGCGGCEESFPRLHSRRRFETFAMISVDCIDCAADESVVNAVNEGINVALSIARVRRPWVMISVNDDREDLHFRKAEFDPEDCPGDCLRPCEKVCPADAILLESSSKGNKSLQSDSSCDKIKSGVITERCYGCGRCLSICPYDKIRAVTYVRDPSLTSHLLSRDDVDAIEIHTSGRGTDLFSDLWSSLGDSLDHVKLIAVSLPDVGPSTVAVMNAICSIMESHPCRYNLWQLDGRPMSGDIGRGATREAIAFAVRLASTQDKPHGFYQVAGGTNSHTIDCLKKVGLFQAVNFPERSSETSGAAKLDGSKQALIGGIAYGGYARKIVGRVLRKIPTQHGHARIEDHLEFLLEALKEASSLLGPVKCYDEYLT
ncbi:uncharacterized protein LOC109716437 isoform X2 [Ananas comosus]|uniref:Uncharacterized protein LOC109716437 isoform X2 n=1 Tax=Ananas comosus TaxID=4615 RepID=A0A6P5FVF7_ANACO|nr:uncharacterized protein LOC109716437 isoform X2 [Ananas comosus]